MGKTVTRQTGPDRQGPPTGAPPPRPESDGADLNRSDPESPDHHGNARRRIKRQARRRSRPPSASGARLGGLILLVLAVAFYYALGTVMVLRIDDDPAFRPARVVTGGRETLAMVAALIHRETVVHHWVANDPPFLPGSLLTRMAAFQGGVIATLAGTVAVFAEQIDPALTSPTPTEADPTEADPTEADPTEATRPLWDSLWSRRLSEKAAERAALRADLRQAADRLTTPGDTWIVDLSRSFERQPSAEDHYDAARSLLLDANRRLAEDPDALPATSPLVTAALVRLRTDLQAMLDRLDARIRDAPGPSPDAPPADALSNNVLYYHVKGRVYAMALILGALARDHPQALAPPPTAAAWHQARSLLETAASLRPLIVATGTLDSLMVPNHLVGQSYLLHQAQAALRKTGESLALEGRREPLPATSPRP